MIKKFKDYDSIQAYEGGIQLEPGGYELKIIGARVEQFDTCDILKVAFDIINHDTYNGYYKKRFETAKAKNPDAKWPGVFDVFIPYDDGTEDDQRTKRAFKSFITSVENSNSGYTWNWDENSLKGRVFGGVFGREEFKTQEGDYKFTVKCRFPRSIEKIKAGDFTIPSDKLHKDHRQAQQSISGMPNQFTPPPATQQPVSAAPMQYNSSGFEEILSDGDVPF